MLKKPINHYLAFAFLLAFVFLCLLFIFRDKITPPKLQIDSQNAATSPTP